MTKEQKHLIELLKSYLINSTTALDDGINFSALYKLSKSHNLSAIIFCVIKNAPNKDIIPSEVYKRFESDFLEAVIRYDFQSKIISEIDSVLTDSKIKHIFFKGAEIRDIYPVPEARIMGDIDLLIKQEDRNRAKETLTDFGFSLENSNGPVYDYRKDGVLIEVHTKIISGKVGNSNAESIFSDATDNAEFKGERGRLDINYHFAYLLTHIAHHFWFYGAGVKLILDLAVIQRKYNINYDIVLNKMDEAGLKDFSKVILSVCNKWFGVGQAFGCNTKKTEEFLLNFGAFGNLNRNKAAVIERKEMEEGKESGAFLTRLRLLFPPYEKLKNIPYISFIEGKPYLVPAAWGYRLFYNLKYRKAFVKNATSKIGSDETNSEAKRELEYFEEIGLL